MKKWSYAAAMLLIASSGCVFTGCIDNDEPYGIQQIRLATASLLEAKKAAIEADKASQAAQDQINILKEETQKIIQETEKIKQEGEKAYKEALAAHEQALADQILEQTKMEIKEREAYLNDWIAKAEINLKTAELTYEQTLYWFEKTKLDNIANNANTNALWGLVQTAFSNYLGALESRNWDLKELLEAQRSLKEFELDLVWKPNADGVGGSFQSPAYKQEAGLKENKAKYEADIEKYQKAVDIWTEFNDKLANSELLELYKTYQAKYDSAIEAKAAAKVALEEAKIDPANKAILDKEAEINAEIVALQTQKNDVPAWKYEATSPLDKLGGDFAKSHYFVKPYQTYVMGGNEENGVTVAETYSGFITEYNDAIAALKKVTLDENDKAWTEAHLTELARAIPAAAKEVTAAWVNAKEVYAYGDVAKANLAPKAAEVAAATTAYNTTVAAQATADAKKAYLDAKEVAEKADAAYDAAVTAALAIGSTIEADWNTYKNALETADEQYKADVAAAVKARDIEIDRLNREQRRLLAEQVTTYNDYLAAEAAAREANSTLTGDALTAAIAADPEVVRTKGLYEDVQDDINAIPDDKEEAQKQYDEDIDTAEKTRDTSITTAEDAWKLAQINNPTTEDKAWIAANDDKEKADNDLVAPQAAWETVKADIKEKMTAYNDAVQAQVDAINELLPSQSLTFAFDSELTPTLSWPVETVDDGARGTVVVEIDAPELPEAVIPFEAVDKGVYTNAKTYLFIASQATFGNLDSYDPGDTGPAHDPSGTPPFFDWIRDDYDPDNAFLIKTPDLANPDLKDPQAILDIFNGYLADDAKYPGAYSVFGAYGDVLTDLYYYNFGSLVLGDSGIDAALRALIEEGTKLRDDLQAQVDDLDDQISKLEYDADKAAEEAKTVLKAQQQAFDLAETEESTYKTIVEALIGVKGNDETPDQIGYLEEFENQLNIERDKLLGDLAEKKLDDLNSSLELAQNNLAEVEYQLDKYEDYAALTNPYQPYVDYLTSKVNKDNELVDFWQKRYTDLEAKYKDIQDKQAAL